MHYCINKKENRIQAMNVNLGPCLTGSSIGLGPCLTKGGGFRVRASRGDTGEYSYPVGSPGPLEDYGDA